MGICGSLPAGREFQTKSTSQSEILDECEDLSPPPQPETPLESFRSEMSSWVIERPYDFHYQARCKLAFRDLLESDSLSSLRLHKVILCLFRESVKLTHFPIGLVLLVEKFFPEYSLCEALFPFEYQETRDSVYIAVPGELFGNWGNRLLLPSTHQKIVFKFLDIEMSPSSRIEVTNYMGLVGQDVSPGIRLLDIDEVKKYEEQLMKSTAHKMSRRPIPSFSCEEISRAFLQSVRRCFPSTVVTTRWRIPGLEYTWYSTWPSNDHAQISSFVVGMVDITNVVTTGTVQLFQGEGKTRMIDMKGYQPFFAYNLQVIAKFLFELRISRDGASIKFTMPTEFNKNKYDLIVGAVERLHDILPLDTVGDDEVEAHTTMTEEKFREILGVMDDVSSMFRLQVRVGVELIAMPA